MKTQRMFDKVAEHLLNQNERCGDDVEGTCFYRMRTQDHRNLKCAVGAIIPDERYEPKYEMNGVVGLSITFPESLSDSLSQVGSVFWLAQMPVLISLQQLHDNLEPAKWAVGLSYIAECYHLEYDGPEWTGQLSELEMEILAPENARRRLREEIFGAKYQLEHAGRAAHEQGRTLRENPYAKDSELAQHWEQGWKDADVKEYVNV